MVLLLSFFAAVSSITSTYASIGPTVNSLAIVNKNIAPDGFNRSTVLAGGTFPGPIIKGQKGGRFRVNVVDKLTDPTMLRTTSIHWHGIFQKRSAWADGPAFVTQCPITPDHSFLYDFEIGDQAGTFWYHSHLSTQYCDGLRGPLIVYDPHDPHQHLYDVDDDSTVITLADWYHAPAPSLAGIVPPPAPNATLINGVGRQPSGPAVPLAVVNVIQGKRYRLRIIGMSCDPNYAFSIDNHQMTVIEADGVNTQPLVVDQIQVFAGQRYSVVVTANQPVANYYIRAEPNAGRGASGFVGGINSAILRYKGAPVSEPKTTRVVKNPLVETNLHPLVKSKTGVPGKHNPGGADVTKNMEFHFNFTTLQFDVNGFPFVPPTVPVLLQILSGAQQAQDILPVGTVYTLPKNKVIDLVIPGIGEDQGGPHPFHLHGQTFHVIRSADSDVYNFDDPVVRDTVNTGLAGSQTTIRFVTDNDGPWLLHCDWHLDMGLAVVMATDPAGTQAANPVPKSWKDLCPIYDALPPSQRP